MHEHVARRLSAELVGTGLLAATVVGSGIAAQRLSPGNLGLELLENSTATGTALVALILAIGPVSGAHFNPLVTLAERLLGGMSSAVAAAYVLVQVIGACAGVAVANLMYSRAAFDVSTHVRSGHGLWLSELVASFGLLIVILGVVRSGRSAVAAFAVGGYIAAAYWFTSSTSFANPALTIARAFTNTFAGIRPGSVPMFVLMEVAGGLLAVALGHYWSPALPAADIVVPRQAEVTEGDSA